MDDGEVGEIFEAYAQEKQDRIPTGQFGNVIRGTGRNVSERDVQQMQQQVDEGGSFTAQGLKSMCQRVPITNPDQERRELIDAFRAFNNRGTMNQKELQQILQTPGGDSLSPQDVQQAMQLCGPDQNGEISIEAFVNAIVVKRLPARPTA